MSPALAGGLFTTEPPGKPTALSLYKQRHLFYNSLPRRAQPQAEHSDPDPGCRAGGAPKRATRWLGVECWQQGVINMETKGNFHF